MSTAIIIQARMSSTRLPGKVLKEVLGSPLLAYQIERLSKVRLADNIIIATTTNSHDQPIVNLCKELGIDYFRGSEEDVLSRYYFSAVEFGVDIIIRITSDCPLIDPIVVDQVIDYYMKNIEKFDYVSNTLQRTYPRGMDTEVFSFNILQEAFTEATSQPEREHVTPFIYWQPSRYSLGNVTYFKDYSKYRWTVDTLEDYRLISNILISLYPHNPYFTLEDCLDVVARNPKWCIINSHIQQKKVICNITEKNRRN